MSMVTAPTPLASGATVTVSMSIRGSHRDIASRTASSISASVLALIGSNSRFQMRQPKAGRMGRSPGAVERITFIAFSTSAVPLDSAIDPLASTRRGNENPWPMNDGSCSPLIAAIPSSVAYVVVPSVDLDHRALDGRDALGLDLHHPATG